MIGSDTRPRHAEDAEPTTVVSNHARHRMNRRGIQPEAVQDVLDYGREIYTRGAFILAIGRREVRNFRREGIDLSSREGVQVVCSPCGCIITVYRNRSFRELRTRRRLRFRHVG